MAKKTKRTMDMDALKRSLDTIYNDDQIYRLKFSELIKQGNSNSNEGFNLLKLINKNDSTNLIKVRSIIDQFGWLGPQKIGDRGNEALFLVIQHAPIEIQKQYLPLLKVAVIDGNAAGADCALLIDRIEMRTGLPQTYGSQTNIIDHVCYAYPIKNIADVNKRRAEVGLKDIESYFKEGNIKYNAPVLSEKEEITRDSLLFELNELYTENQDNINAYLKTRKIFGKGSDQEIKEHVAMNKSANEALEKTKLILDSYGWPPYYIVGVQGSMTLFLIFSHADTKTIEKYLPALRKTVARGEASISHLVSLEDKVEIGKGQPQIYGTQIIPGTRKPYPIKNENLVNERRSELGLQPLEDYLKQTYNIDYKPAN